MNDVTIFGLAFDVEKSSAHNSGFQPAEYDLNSGRKMYGDLRLSGFAALLRTRFAKNLTIVGGAELRYADDKPPVSRAHAIREMLIHDRFLAPERIHTLDSFGNTEGNIAAIKAQRTGEDSCIVSNLYHLPRIAHELARSRLHLRLLPAEALVLMENMDRKQEVWERLGSSELAARCVEEAQGIAQKLQERIPA